MHPNNFNNFIANTLKTKNYLDKKALKFGNDATLFADLFLVKDLSGKYRFVNENLAKMYNYQSAKHMLALDVADDELNCEVAEIGDIIIAEDQRVLSSRIKSTFITFGTYADNKNKIALGHKKPICDAHNQIVGIIGTYSDITNNTLAIPLLALHQMDNKLFGKNSQNSYQIKDFNSDSLLTNREALCVFYLMRSKNAREIAKYLHISVRTVEAYINTLKEKLGCASKGEIIDRMFEIGMNKVIPRGVIHFLI